MNNLDISTVMLFLQIRLTITRAAQKDSLNWWDDEALTTEGAFVLDRIFPIAPSLAAKNLALSAAAARHQTAFVEIDSPIHLFRLDHRRNDYLTWRHNRLVRDLDFSAPIPDLDSLRQRLLMLIGREPEYHVIGRRMPTGALRIHAAASSTMTEKAGVLAFAYLEGELGQPIFPFLVEQA